jgi:hypothetical protein
MPDGHAHRNITGDRSMQLPYNGVIDELQAVTDPTNGSAATGSGLGSARSNGLTVKICRR